MDVHLHCAIDLATVNGKIHSLQSRISHPNYWCCVLSMSAKDAMLGIHLALHGIRPFHAQCWDPKERVALIHFDMKYSDMKNTVKTPKCASKPDIDLFNTFTACLIRE